MNEMTDEQVERMLNDTFTCDELERLRHRKDSPMIPPRRYLADDIQRHCPPGYRFLVQCVGATNDAQAAAYVTRTFRRIDAVFVRGVYRPENTWLRWTPWTFRPDDGYMAFVPQ